MRVRALAQVNEGLMVKGRKEVQDGKEVEDAEYGEVCCF